MNSYNIKKSHEDTQTANLQSKQESTKPKQTEEKPREIKGYLDNMIESSLDGIVISDNMGYVTRVNNSFLKLIDFEEEEIIGKHIMELSITEEGTYESTTGELVEISKDFFYNAMEMTEKLFEEGNISNWESYYLRKDGKIVPIEMNVAYLYDENGDITGSVGINRDITERRRSEKRLKQAYAELEKRVEERTANLKVANEQLKQRISERKEFENSLKKAEARYHNLIEFANVGIIVAENNKITQVNRIAGEIYGYSKEELIGQSPQILTPEKYRTQHREVFNTIFQSEKAKKVISEEEGIKKDGTLFPIEISFALTLEDEQRIIGVVRDITERKKAEKEIKEARDFLENIFKTSADGIMITDSRGSITTVNEAVEKMLGYSHDELIGKHPTELLLRENIYKERENKIVKEMREGNALGLEYTWRRKDGSPVDIEMNVAYLKDIKGNLKGAVGSLRDITARKQVEKELRETKDHLDNIIENSLDAIMVTDDMGTITRVNKYCLELLDYKEEELVGKHTTECTPMNVGETYESTTGELVKIDQEFYDYGQAIMGRLIETGKVSNWETYYFCKDKKVVPVEQSIVWLCNKEGERSEAVAIIRDITERKRAEKELRETKDYLDNIIESSLDAIVVSDSFGKLTKINKSFLNLIGREVEEVLGKLIVEFTPREEGTYESIAGEAITIDKDFFEEAEKQVTTLYEKGKITDWESCLLNKDGKVISVDMSIVFMYNKQDEGIGTVGIIRDITERRQADKELRETKDQLDNIIERSLDPIIISDGSGNIIRVNNSLIKLIGYSQDEIIGKHTMELVPTEDGIYESTAGEQIKIDGDFHKGSEEHVTILFEEGKVINWETYYFHKNKKVIPVEMNIVVLHNKKGEGVGAVGIIRDITERRRAEKERERLLGELKDKNKELEQVFYVASHDLRSPLVNVQGFSKELSHAFIHIQSVLHSSDVPSTLKENITPTLEEDIPEALQYIHTSIAKMDSLLSCLLRLSRLGRAALNIKQLNMNKLISDIIKTFEYKIKEKGIIPQIHELPPCFGDETQINQVFSNLLDNALKYLDPKRPGIINISGKQENGQVIYHVEDNGIGIAEEHQGRIYEIFYRLNPEASTGEGLGLTITRRILDRHAGKIWVKSEPGKGSTFFVSLLTN